MPAITFGQKHFIKDYLHKHLQFQYSRNNFIVILLLLLFYYSIIQLGCEHVHTMHLTLKIKELFFLHGAVLGSLKILFKSI